MKTKMFLVFLCCSLIIALCPVASATPKTYYSTGDLLTDEDYLCLEDYPTENDISPLANYTPPMKYDLSESIYFPPIQDQGLINSCGAFAMGYYQFTYEKNKLNAVPSTTADTWASPMWIYNTLNEDPIANHNGGVGLRYIDTDQLLRYQGAVSWSEMPYTSSNYDRVFTWYDDDAANILRNALKTRLSGRTHKSIKGFASGNFNTPSITSATDKDLNEIKELLANQKKVLMVRMKDSNNFITKSTTNNEEAWVRGVDDGTDFGHAMVVVGYDDTIACDINGDGVIEAAERGAFKLANSWGSTWGNSGFIWVMYDALNYKSAVSGNWESEFSDTRISIFDRMGTDKSNEFIGIYVENKAVQLTAEVTFCSSSLRDTKFELKKRHYFGTSMTTNNSDTFYSGDIGTPIPADCTVAVMDFSDLFDYTALTNNSYQFGFEISMANSENGQQIDWFEAALTDDLGNLLTEEYEYNDVNSDFYMYYKILGFKRGDVSYDRNIDSTDALQVMQYINGQREFSKIQKYLADYNNDGYINNADVQAILQHSVANSVDPVEQANAMALLSQCA